MAREKVFEGELKHLRTSLRNFFLTGPLLIVPSSVTGYAIWFLLKAMDAILRYVPAKYLPETYLHIHIPGLGLILAVFLVFAVGLLTRNFVGRKMVYLGEKIVDRIPLARIICVGVKQLLEALFSEKSKAFERAALIEYPKHGA